MKRVILLLFMCLSLVASSENTKYGKMILIYVEMDNCPWCIKMDREVFDNLSNLSELQKNYHVQRLKRMSGDVPSFMKVKYYPTTFILSSDGNKIVDELPGYMKAEDYLDYLNILQEIERE